MKVILGSFSFFQPLTLDQPHSLWGSGTNIKEKEAEFLQESSTGDSLPENSGFKMEVSMLIFFIGNPQKYFFHFQRIQEREEMIPICPKRDGHLEIVQHYISTFQLPALPYTIEGMT